MNKSAKFDPYEILDIGRDAGRSEVKTAYRAKAKRLHPDAGGNPEEFATATKAYALLTDARRRAKYDETGEADETVADDITQKAYALIGEMLASFINADQEPTQRDIVNEMRAMFQVEIASLQDRLKGPQRAIDRARKMELMIKRKSGENFIARMLAKHAEDSARAVTIIETDITRRERAVEILADYDFPFETIVEFVRKHFDTI